MEILEKSALPARPIQYKKIPSYLIYEEENGQPIYYRGYKDVLAGTKHLEEIMGCSSLQSLVVRALLKYLYANVDGNGMTVFTNEKGLHISKGNNRASDIAIYQSEQLVGYQFNNKYFNIPPFIGIEVDIKADLSESKWEIYIERKTKRLHGWGVHTIIWILTASRQILICRQGQTDWESLAWEDEFEVVPGHRICIGEMLMKD